MGEMRQLLPHFLERSRRPGQKPRRTMCRICSETGRCLAAFNENEDVPPACNRAAELLKVELRERLASSGSRS